MAAAFLFLLAGLGLKVRAWAVPRLAKADWLAEGKLPVTVPINAWLLKEEQVLFAPERGQVRLLARHGERVRSGAPVAEILPAGTEGARKAVVYAPRAGVFCASTDGLEEVLRKTNPLDLKAVEKLEGRSAAVETGSVVEKGQPVGKVVDNLAGVWCWFSRPQDERAAGRLAAGQWVGLLWEGESLRARVEKAAQGEVLLYLPHMPAELVPQRRVKLELVCGELKGFLVPPGSVVERNGQPGIYVILDRRATWVPVQVLGATREGAVITGAGLSPLTRYVIRPAWVREGDRLE